MNVETTSAASRILIVEDEPAINDVVATALRFQGYSVSQFGDGVAGLGLALVRRIAEGHRGEVTVEPTPDGGATFCLRIPGKVGS